MKQSKTKHPAVHMKALRAKKLAALLHSCIPTTCVKTIEEVDETSGTTYIVNPDIKPNGNGKTWKPDSTYRDTRDTRKKYLKEHFRSETKSKRPWYYLTKGKCRNYETRKKSWGDHTDFFRVDSETKILHEKYIPKKFTRAVYVMGVVQDTVKRWEKTHPMPTETIEGTKNMFYHQEYSQWMNERSKIWNDKLLSIKNRPEHLLSEYLQHKNFNELAAAA